MKSIRQSRDSSALRDAYDVGLLRGEVGLSAGARGSLARFSTEALVYTRLYFIHGYETFQTKHYA